MKEEVNQGAHPVITKDNKAKTIYEVFSKLSDPSKITFDGNPYSESIAENTYTVVTVNWFLHATPPVKVYFYNNTDLGVTNSWGEDFGGGNPICKNQVESATSIQFETE